MAGRTSMWKQRQLWTGLMALAALAFWIVGLGAGWRGWILGPNEGGIVAHAQAFGVEAFIWWTPATVLTLTTVLMAIGISIVRHLVDAPQELPHDQEPSPDREPLPALGPVEAPDPAETGAEATGADEADAEENDSEGRS